MTKRNQSTEPQPRPKTNPALDRLGILAGAWNVEMSSMSFHPDPSAVVRYPISFDWIEGATFMAQHEEAISPEIPYGTWIIGPDDAAGTYCVLHYDSRGVSRIYQMSLDAREWKVWRDFPGFSQRFTGTFSEDGNTINASWENSNDGATWKHDFNLTYTRVNRPRDNPLKVS